MIFFIINHTSIKLGRKVYLNMKKKYGQWSFSIYTKNIANGAAGSPKCKCCSVAFKSLNIAPLGRKEDNLLGSR